VYDVRDRDDHDPRHALRRSRGARSRGQRTARLTDRGVAVALFGECRESFERAIQRCVVLAQGG
jgi:hypothetical protein